MCYLGGGRVGGGNYVLEEFFGDGCDEIEAVFESGDGLHGLGYKVAVK